jgi:quinol-cytochrome oxidoreductase complex cytochrome b subunit
MYDSSKILHLFAVIALIGPLLLTPKWVYLYRSEMGRKLLHELHLVTGIAGWIVLLSGTFMLYLQNWALLSLVWLQVSLGLFVAIQIFDHFWADIQEEKLEQEPENNTSRLKIWFLVKLGLYSLITILMIVKQ